MNDGGPAFPEPDSIASDGTNLGGGSSGMSHRDYLAAKAMQALLAFDVSQFICNHDPRYTGKNFTEVVAINAYEFADGMIAESQRKNQ